MASLERNLQNRKWLVNRLKAELIGPDAPVKKIDSIQPCDGQFFTWEDFRKPKVQANGEEIVWQDSPVKRYGAGILFPFGVTEVKQLAAEADSTPQIEIDIVDIQQDAAAPDELLESRASSKPENTKILADDSENYDVTLANAYRPSAMGLSFLCDFAEEVSGIRVEIECARYRKLSVSVGESLGAEKKTERELWLREPVKADGNNPVEDFTASELLSNSIVRRWISGQEEKLQLVIVSRQVREDENFRLLTVSLVNRQKTDSGRIDELCFFQTGFKVRGVSDRLWIAPYPEVIRPNRKAADEEEIIRLLYRDRQTFAIGHGCAGSWTDDRPARVKEVWTETMPTFQTPGTSADLRDKNNKPITVSMRKLAGLDSEDDGSGEIFQLVTAYRDWINDLTYLQNQEHPVPDDLKDTSEVLISRCRQCLERIEDGINFLTEENETASRARKAFLLANKAMLLSQLRATREVREPVWMDGLLSWNKDISAPDPRTSHPQKGYWRAFQIAFLLMSLRGICQPDHDDRSLVDLIWFPTGGGKTEAYLGLTAFTVFYNRLSGIQCNGANVLMRYTLRLLTAQQFQRAALLFCSMEYMRRNDAEVLGDKPFRLGMWVGGSATPNKRDEARRSLTALQNNPDSENPFVMLKCPWCGARFGTVEISQTQTRQRGRSHRGANQGHHRTLGYHVYSFPDTTIQTVAFRCPDIKCDYGYVPGIKENPPLPIFVIDEDIYEFPPDLIIGTVDKFAMLAWNPGIRSIFGIDSDGKHDGLPPSLIIQDELHLISGPLGSMVGAYETAIEELCTRRDEGKMIVPKIVASTATISRADEQVKALYARDKVMLFPPAGLNAGDSFFAREERNEDGTLKPGRLYTGILAPGHGSQQTTIARVFATLLQWPAVMDVLDSDDSERDPWWTLLSFFNSLRELGGATTLLVADARDYLRVILDRHGYPYQNIRQLLNWIELTSRIREDHIPKAIQSLEKTLRRDTDGFLKDAIEVCLASNIIEVGVDIDRLSLMTIVGQPKTTSQYIQVSSRVGRSGNSPGLVAVTYSQSKPRDKSHYERFRSYHQRLYAQVEPTSVTPFSPPAVERSLHGVIVALARQLLPVSQAVTPRPFPLMQNSQVRILVERVIEKRVDMVDSQEKINVTRWLQKRFSEWLAWDPAEYGGFGAPPESPPLMHPAGSQQQHSWNGHSWSTLSSLRDVDATCEAEVTVKYNEVQEEQSI